MCEETYDVIIMGGGPGGLTAGIYTSRQNLKSILFEAKHLGGRAWGPHKIENYPGFPSGVTGTELMDAFVEQARIFGVIFKEETVVGLTDMGGTKIVLTRGGFYQAKSVIISTGIQRKQMSIPGEQEFKGRGVSYCAICDGPFFRDQVVAVVGAGKDAVEDAVRLSEIARKVYVLSGSEGFTVEKESLTELFEKENVKIFDGNFVTSIKGKDIVTHITLENGPAKNLDVNGIFLIPEVMGSTNLILDAGIKTDDNGHIIVDKNQMTNIDGVYAVGECVTGGMQIVTAAGEGAKAGLAAFRYIRSRKKESI
jgi:thioredoxin reductase (NADPH)